MKMCFSFESQSWLHTLGRKLSSFISPFISCLHLLKQMQSADDSNNSFLWICFYKKSLSTDILLLYVGSFSLSFALNFISIFVISIFLQITSDEIWYDVLNKWLILFSVGLQTLSRILFNRHILNKRILERFEQEEIMFSVLSQTAGRIFFYRYIRSKWILRMF